MVLKGFVLAKYIIPVTQLRTVELQSRHFWAHFRAISSSLSLLDFLEKHFDMQ
jgi:hypothetical protein